MGPKKEFIPSSVCHRKQLWINIRVWRMNKALIYSHLEKRLPERLRPPRRVSPEEGTRERVETQHRQGARSTGWADKERPERNQLPEPERPREAFHKHLTRSSFGGCETGECDGEGPTQRRRTYCLPLFLILKDHSAARVRRKGGGWKGRSQAEAGVNKVNVFRPKERRKAQPDCCRDRHRRLGWGERARGLCVCHLQ